MKTNNYLPCWLLSLLALLSLYSLPVLCSFDRGDRYWNGRPQPIGIDFQSGQVVAVFADGPNNFTTLAFVQRSHDSVYSQYINVLCDEQHVWDRISTAVLNDDDQFVVEDSKVLIWLQDALNRFKDWSRSFRTIACRKLYPLLHNSHAFLDLCFPEELYEYQPIKPRSRYQSLLTQRRVRHLRGMMPKWSRSPQPGQLSKSGFVLIFFDVLEQVKQEAMQQNVNIKSASISLPDWVVYNEWSDLVEEACLLADIELYEQPRNRFESAANTAVQEGRSLLVVDHGLQHLELTYGEWNEQEKSYSQRLSSSLKGMGFIWMFQEMTFHVLNAYNRNSNVSMEEGQWPLAYGLTKIATEVATARNQLRFGLGFPKSLDDVPDIATAVNLTELSGLVRIVIVTAQDVLDVEGRYIEEISDEIKSLLQVTDLYVDRKRASSGELKDIDTQDVVSRMDGIDSSEDTITKSAKTIGNPAIDTTFEVIIVDTKGHEVDVLRRALHRALKDLGLNTKHVEDDTCYPYYAIAAHGAALRARDWITYYDSYFAEIEHEGDDYDDDGIEKDLDE